MEGAVRRWRVDEAGKSLPNPEEANGVFGMEAKCPMKPSALTNPQRQSISTSIVPPLKMGYVTAAVFIPVEKAR